MIDPLHPSFSAFIEEKYPHKKDQDSFFSRDPQEVLTEIKEQLVNRFEFAKDAKQALASPEEIVREISGREVLKLRKEIITNPTDTHQEKEVRFERMLTQHDENLFNQFSFFGKIAVDLVATKNNQITHLFELKTRSNNLRYAAYELVFYYLLLRKACQQHLPIYHKKTHRVITCASVMKLCVLVPPEWDEENRFLACVQAQLVNDGAPILYRRSLFKNWEEHLEGTAPLSEEEFSAWICRLYQP